MYGEGHYYFAYGSNMNARRVAARKMVFSSYEGGVLPDYRLAFNKRSVKQPGAASANVIAAPGHRVEGVVYELPGAGEIETMDPFEGHPVRYLRQRLPVICGDGTVLAWVYLANGEFIEE
ncbi:MAG: gamma-glutamylcyclotransferase family protein, partial [Pseudomonadales bacterium]